MKFNICVVSPQGYIHIGAFSELSELLCYGLQDLGHSAAVTANHLIDDGRNIIIGCHLASTDAIAHVPPETVMLNTEPMVATLDRREWNATIVEWARHFEVWDYSERNAAALATLSGRPVKFLPLGYHPRLHRIPVAASQDIDVLFYGSITDRRARIVHALKASGIIPHLAFGVYGAERDALIARAKIVLNIHANDEAMFEIVRVSYLMNNAKAVVAEVNPQTSADAALPDGICAVPADEIATACRRLINDPPARRALEIDALETLKLRPQAGLLMPLLDG